MAEYVSYQTAVPSYSRKLQIRVSPETRDFLAFSLWCGITFVQFPGDQLLLYPLALYYAWAVWRDQTKIVPLLIRAWPILLFPVWCMISPLWAVVPANALKQSLYLILTIMICFQVAATMNPRRILYAILLATAAIGLVSMFYGVATGDMQRGIFGQKNAMGKNMVVLWVVSSAVLLDSGTARWIRMLALAMAALAVFMAFLSQSATAVLLILATGALNLAGAVFLVGGLLRAGNLAALSLFIALMAFAGCLLLPGLQDSPVDAVLGHFGKDSTLTGRTVLWTYAEQQIADHPFLGVGAGGFWRYYDSPQIQKIFEDFHKGPNDHFNFHNSYYEIAVHQGLIGLSLAIVALAWGIFQVVRGAVLVGALPLIYFLTQTLTVLVRTSTEADFLKPFVLFHMIFWIGAISATRILAARRLSSQQNMN